MVINKYKSKFETRIAAQLKKAGVKFEYEKTSYTYQSRVRTAARCSRCGCDELYCKRVYTPDFFLENGIIIESKGKWTSADRYKMLDVRNSNPTLEVKMLFMRDNKINKNSKTRYSDWCKANDIDFAVGTLRDDWKQKRI